MLICVYVCLCACIWSYASCARVRVRVYLYAYMRLINSWCCNGIPRSSNASSRSRHLRLLLRSGSSWSCRRRLFHEGPFTCFHHRRTHLTIYYSFIDFIARLGGSTESPKLGSLTEVIYYLFTFPINSLFLIIICHIFLYIGMCMCMCMCMYIYIYMVTIIIIIIIIIITTKCYYSHTIGDKSLDTKNKDYFSNIYFSCDIWYWII